MIGHMLAAIAKRAAATFANFTYQSKETGEVARYSLILGASTETLYERDLQKLDRAIRLLRRIGASAATIQAAEELQASRIESLTKGIGNNSGYTNAETYDYVENLKGVRIHRDTGVLYVSGLVNRKEVIRPGAPRKPVKSSPKTIAKRRLGYMLPSGRYRLFTLPNVERAAINGDVLELVTQPGV